MPLSNNFSDFLHFLHYNTNLNQYVKASNFATVKHATQTRKGNTKSPYINHPIEVANFLSTHGVLASDVLVAALLHDTLEDTNTTELELKEQFGENIALIVKQCSDDKSLDKVTRKKLQIQNAAYSCIGAKLVKLADKWSNVSSLINDPPTDWSQEYILGYARWGYAVCEAIYKSLENHVDDCGKKSFYHNSSKQYITTALLKIRLDLQKLFDDLKVTDVTSEQLESFYELIRTNEEQKLTAEKHLKLYYNVLSSKAKTYIEKRKNEDDNSDTKKNKYLNRTR